MIVDEQVQKHISSLIDSLKELLGRFANEDGVEVQYNTQQRNWIRFRFLTPDRIGVVVTYDVNQTSKEYIDRMVHNMRTYIDNQRRERHDNPIIVDWRGVQ